MSDSDFTEVGEVERIPRVLEHAEVLKTLEDLKKQYPNINFDSTIIALPRVDDSGNVCRDEKGYVIFTCKKLALLTDADRTLIQQQGLDIFFHGLGCGGRKLEAETRYMCGGRPMISLDWHTPTVTSCEKAGKDLFNYLSDVVMLRRLAVLIGYSMGNLSMKSFVDEALTKAFNLEETEIRYKKIPVLHPERLVFDRADYDRIGAVCVDSMIGFRYKKHPFKILRGCDIFHLITYTKNFMKEQARRLNYATDRLHEVSGVKMAEYVNARPAANQSWSEYYNIKTIIDNSFDAGKAAKKLGKNRRKSHGLTI